MATWAMLEQPDVRRSIHRAETFTEFLSQYHHGLTRQVDHRFVILRFACRVI
jgi:hypothetical protein